MGFFKAEIVLFQTDLDYGYGFKERARFLHLNHRLCFSNLAFCLKHPLYRPIRLNHTFACTKRLYCLKHRSHIDAFHKRGKLFFKKSFTKVHHYFAAAGLVLITLHPIAVSIQALNIAILLPNLRSPYLFLFYGGSVALISIYIAFGAVLLRRKINAYWRPFHALMYMALFFGVVHANLIGFDLQNIYFKVVYDALFAGVLVAFGLKRWQFHRIKARRNNMVNHPK